MNLDGYDEARPFYPWISTIAVRLAQNWLVRRRRINTREGAELEPDRAVARPASTHSLNSSPTRRTAISARGGRTPSGAHRGNPLLPPGHERKGVAGALGVTSGTVKTLLFRALRKPATRHDRHVAMKETP